LFSPFLILGYFFLNLGFTNINIFDMEQVSANAPIDYLPILFQLIVAAGFGIGTIIITHLIGPKVRTANKLSSFESGIEVVGNARQPFSIKYFLVAILFVIFDVEVIFMYPWAVNFREFGFEGLIQMFIFMAMLLLGFIYVIKKKALSWD
jgi:NADH-quinone oxidoreductase subunit A